MKTSTVIFILIGVCIIIAGLILCNTADAQARADGYDLHEGFYDENGNIITNHSFALEDDINVSKISVELDGMDVEIIGGAVKSEIVCENVYPGSYAFYVSNKVVTLTNMLDTSNIMDALGAIEFDGIRRFFDPTLFNKRDQKIYIYINENAETIKQLSFKLKNCNVKVSNVSGSLDFRVNAENCSLVFSDCITDSSVYTKATNCDLSFINFEFNRSEFELNQCKYKFDSSLILLYRFDVISDQIITANGQEYSDYYILYPEFESYPLVKIKANSSEVTIKYLS